MKDGEECEAYGDTPQNSLIDVDAGSVVLGKNRDARLFGWDNEYGTHQAEIPAFKASKYLVSNGEYLEFVEEEGYANNAYWCEEGKEWKEFVRSKIILFFGKKKRGNIYFEQSVEKFRFL